MNEREQDARQQAQRRSRGQGNTRSRELRPALPSRRIALWGACMAARRAHHRSVSQLIKDADVDWQNVRLLVNGNGSFSIVHTLILKSILKLSDKSTCV